jgi:hypothetical protein
MRIKLVLILFISLFIISCGDKPTEPSKPLTEIWPLAEGNFWTFHLFSYQSHNPTLHSDNDTITMRVSKKANIDGEEWYLINVGSKILMVAKNKSDGFWGHEFKDFSEIHNPLAGMRIKYPTFDGDGNPYVYGEYLTISINNTITTPAGKFDCIRYLDGEIPKLKDNGNFFSPGVGFVYSKQIEKIDPYHQIPDTTWAIMELVSYRINNQ